MSTVEYFLKQQRSNKPNNIPDLLINRALETPQAILFSLPNEIENSWSKLDAVDFLEHVIQTAKGLIFLGVKPGDKIAFLAKTTYEWTLIDFAIWFSGAIMVPIYDTSSDEQIDWLLSDSEACAVISNSASDHNKITSLTKNNKNIKWHLDISNNGLNNLIEKGKEITDENVYTQAKTSKLNDIATLIYTSGSTGRPKGVMLTHNNFVQLSVNIFRDLHEVLYKDAAILLFITATHVYARLITVLAIHAGVRVGHQPDTNKLLESFQNFKPTLLLAVPRLFEKVYNSAEQKATLAGKGKVFKLAAETAVAHSRASDQNNIPLSLKIKFKIFDKLVYKKLREALGGHCKYAVSGAAPLNERLSHFYRSLGIYILEGYGLTESTGPATVNRPNNIHLGTVGEAITGVNIKLAKDGEILLKGINIFTGYWNNPDATAESFTKDNYYKTGDLGEINNGVVKIIGRKKEILVTAGGKNVAPNYLEDPIRSHTLISQIVVIGDKRPFISALITLDQEMLKLWLKSKNINENISMEEAVTNTEVLAEIDKVINEANSKVSRAESIRKYKILTEDFTEQNGTLTPKQSIKRYVILEKYSSEIDEIYGGPISDI